MGKLPLLILCSLMTAAAASAGPCLKDVRSSFELVNEEATPLVVWTNEVFDRGSYRQIMKTRFGLDNHIQGIVRIPGTSVFVLSGGDRYIKEANLFIVSMDSGKDQKTISKNFTMNNARDASISDGFMTKMNIGSEAYWHAGGLAVVDNVLAVPIENPNTKTSKITFYDLSDSFDPKKLETEIIRPTTTTGTVLFYRNPQGKLIVGGSVNGKMEFFESRTSDLKDGFLETSTIVDTKATGQGTDVVQQCDGKLFILDFNNSSSLAPIVYGKNYVRLFDLDLQSGKTNLLSRRTLNSKRACNFKAAGSHHVTEDGELVLYGSSFYRHFAGKQFKMCQFSE